MSHNSNRSKVRVVAYNYNENEDVMDKETKINLDDLEPVLESKDVIHENYVFVKMLGKEILVIMSAHQLNILGQTFRPIFCGTVAEVTNGFITLNPVIVKMSNAPFFQYPIPLSFPIENITHFIPFDCNVPFPIS